MAKPAAELDRDAHSNLRVPAVFLDQVRFGYTRNRPILVIPKLEIERGEKVFIFGPSGSGKTTLLGLLAGVLRADSGTVRVLGTDLTTLSNRQRDRVRAAHVGYIFQLFNLIPYLSVEENIVLPCRVSRERRGRLQGTTAEAAARRLARTLEIENLFAERVTKLSVGQQQRVAAARALIGAPELVVADEPTSSLDADLRERFLELLFDRCAAAAATLVFVSHDRQLEHMFDRSLSLPEINVATR